MNFINDANERVKIKIARKGNDEIINVEPGKHFRTSGSVNFGFDIEVDIIINPKGPDNNERLGDFKFNNPAVGSPSARSTSFYWTALSPIISSGSRLYVEYKNKYDREKSRTKVVWGLKPAGVAKDIPFPAGLEENPFSLELFRFELSEVWFQAAPIFETEAFMQDDGAKKWDLRIKTVPVYLPDV